MSTLPEHFAEFISQNCDRRNFILRYLAARGIDTAVLPVDGKNHIYVKFPQTSYNPQFRIKTVMAHYDRVEHSPGANDNSAAVFCLMDWAERLLLRKDIHNIRLIFTDGEELGKNGVSEQGAFSLASQFRRLGITNDDVYVFDCMGRGTIPVLGKAAVSERLPYQFRKRFADLEDRTENLLRSAAKRWLTLPLPYSDNAGFIACGIPAVALTMLPEDDADKYLFNLMKNKKLESFVTNHEAVSEKDGIPETWKMFHTQADNAENLTPVSFELTAKILDALADLKTLAL